MKIDKFRPAKLEDTTIIPDSLVASIDLGSNSFKLMIARIKLHEDIFHLQEIDTIKSTIRLAAGIDENGYLTDDAMNKALSTLLRFSDRIQNFSKKNVTAVATNVFRVAKNGSKFLKQCEEVLGFKIHLLSGEDEARFVFQGASHVAPFCPGKRLVIDIGGSSTEIILGQDEKINVFDSLQLGCVTHSEEFFKQGKFEKEFFDKAIEKAKEIIKPSAKKYHPHSFLQVVGSSGTIRAVADIISMNQFDAIAKLPIGDVGTLITIKGLNKVKEHLIKAKNIDFINLAGLKTQRKPVIAGGLSILIAIFEIFKIEMMEVSESAIMYGALHEAILNNIKTKEDDYAAASKKIIHYDDYEPHHDRREDEVDDWVNQFSVDKLQARRISRLAQEIYKNFSKKDDSSYQNSKKILKWACKLHEIGLVINARQYHLHSSYIISHKELSAFSISDQARLASLVMAHRGRLEKINLDKNYLDWGLLFALRVAFIFHKKRIEIDLPKMNFKLKSEVKVLEIDKKWLDKFPFIHFGLQKESISWERLKTAFRLEFK